MSDYTKPKPTDAELADVHEGLDALLFESKKATCKHALLAGRGLRYADTRGAKETSKFFSYPTRAGWAVSEASEAWRVVKDKRKNKGKGQ